MDLDIVVRGLTSGSLYSLVAVSFNILYRPTNVFNFAQGDLVMLGAMFGASLTTMFGLPWIVGLLLSLLGVGLVALLEERITVAPILARSPTAHGWVITTLAFSLIIGNLVGHVWSPDPIMVKPPAPLSTDSFILGGMRVSSYQIALIAATIGLVFMVERFYRTRRGMAVIDRKSVV